MTQWMQIVIVALLVVTAVSSTYSAYKVYQFTDARIVPVKGKR